MKKFALLAVAISLAGIVGARVIDGTPDLSEPPPAAAPAAPADTAPGGGEWLLGALLIGYIVVRRMGRK